MGLSGKTMYSHIQWLVQADAEGGFWMMMAGRISSGDTMDVMLEKPEAESLGVKTRPWCTDEKLSGEVD